MCFGLLVHYVSYPGRNISQYNKVTITTDNLFNFVNKLPNARHRYCGCHINDNFERPVEGHKEDGMSAGKPIHGEHRNDLERDQALMLRSFSVA